jgi:magnesium transporter
MFAMNEVINCAAYSKGLRVANVELKDINRVLQQDDHFIWIGLHEPSEEVLNEVQQQFCLHDLAVEDAHNAHQRPKIETYGETIFIVLRTAQMNEKHHIDFGETHFFVGANFLVTVRHGSSLAYTEVRNRCESTPQLLGKGQGFALYAVMDSIVDQYFPVVDALETELTAIEKKYSAKSQAGRQPNRSMN